MRTINVNLTTEQAKKVDKTAKERGFANRSEFFRAVLRYVFSPSAKILERLDSFVFEEPLSRDKKKIIAEFRKTGRYSDEFIESLAKGLEKSNYFNQ